MWSERLSVSPRSGTSLHLPLLSLLQPALQWVAVGSLGEATGPGSCGRAEPALSALP